MVSNLLRSCIRIFVFILICSLWNSCDRDIKQPEFSIIPAPVDIKISYGSFKLNKDTRIIVDNSNSELNKLATYLDKIIQYDLDLKLSTGDPESSEKRNLILLSLIKSDTIIGEEGYYLNITPEKVTLEAVNPAGIFYGIQTLLQLFPESFHITDTKEKSTSLILPCVSIIDYPRFQYRGMHLDVSRHFFPVEFIKKYIDLIAMYKMNRFHWHLTDDNGWRIEIKQYPELQEISAWRVERENMRWRDVTPPEPGEKATYGGYYSQEEVKEVIDYANSKYVTIIPEIEMPGHSSEVLAAYPELSCTGGPFYVQPGSYWPNIDIFCAGKEETFEFLENVLDEVVKLFPSEYIHIGGDEADKTNWRKCPDCQKRIIDEKLNDEDELQSYFIKRMEKYINSKGKQIIGWDEILEGGLAPGATVMSWRGMEGGIAAAKQGHDVIMTPTSHCYFDYYQADPEFQPVAIGGFTTLKKVYSFEPVPPELTSDEAGHILGTQGNIWTEYIKTPEHAEYMSVPRMCALAEVAWTPTEKKSWDDFLRRINEHYKLFEKNNVNYCDGSYKIDFETKINQDGQIILELESEIMDPEIHYSLDGSEPTPDHPVYREPILIDNSKTIKAVIFRNEQKKENTSVQEILIHKGIAKPVDLKEKYHHRYEARGEHTLVNGIPGSSNFNDGQWLGFHGKDVDVVIDLQEVIPVTKITTSFYQRIGSWIFLPYYVEISISNDNRDYSIVDRIAYPELEKHDTRIIQGYSTVLEGAEARFVRIFARNIGVCPEWHPGSGEKAWLFVDEIVIK